MTERDRLFWLKVQRRTSTMTPDMAADVLRAFRIVRESLTDFELLQLVNDPALIDQIINDALLDRAFIPLRDRILLATKRGFESTVRELPNAGKVAGSVAVQFDVLSPDVIDAVRKIDTRVINTLKDDIRDVVRAHVENGLRDGRPPKSVARELRAVIGLAPNQEEAVRNFRRALEGDPGAGSPFDRKLRDRRFDRALHRGKLTEAQIETMTTAYRRRFVAFNANVNAKTATLDSYKLGQSISWKSARDRGVIPPGYELAKQWIQIDRPTKRESHIPLHGETVAFDATYSNGDEIPGESDFNCACLSRVFLKKTA